MARRRQRDERRRATVRPRSGRRNTVTGSGSLVAVDQIARIPAPQGMSSAVTRRNGTDWIRYPVLARARSRHQLRSARAVGFALADVGVAVPDHTLTPPAMRPIHT